MQRLLSISGDIGCSHGRQHVSPGPATSRLTSRERVRSLPILVERQDGWPLDWIDVVHIGTRRPRRLNACARDDIEKNGR